MYLYLWSINGNAKTAQTAKDLFLFGCPASEILLFLFLGVIDKPAGYVLDIAAYTQLGATLASICTGLIMVKSKSSAVADGPITNSGAEIESGAVANDIPLAQIESNAVADVIIPVAQIAQQ